MTTIFVGEPEPPRLRSRGPPMETAQTRRLGAGSAAGARPAELERRARRRARSASKPRRLAQETDSIVLADDSDAALAAALVAAKLLIPLSAADRPHGAPSSANGRLIAQLAGAYTRPA